MQRRKLGNSDLQIGPLVFGGNVFGWTADESMSFKLLDAFIESGLNMVDTADVYSIWAPGNKGGDSEAIIGNWLQRRGKRDDVVIATKVGMKMTGELGRDNLKKQYIRSSIENSLRRLKTDYVDLYQSHTDDPDTPLEETLEAFSELIKEGKVRWIGASNYNGKRLAEALEISKKNKLARYESLQPEYNLYDRAEYEKDLEPACLEHAVSVISYFSLARGFLSGKYRSEADLNKGPRGAGAKKYMNERGTKILAALDQVAKEYQSTPARVSLAWLIARPSVTAPIASATNLEQLSDLVESTKLQLSSESIKLLDDASRVLEHA